MKLRLTLAALGLLAGLSLFGSSAILSWDVPPPSCAPDCPLTK